MHLGDVDLGQITVWGQGSDNRTVLDDSDVDLGQITVWSQGNDDSDGLGRFG